MKLSLLNEELNNLVFKRFRDVKKLQNTIINILGFNVEIQKIEETMTLDNELTFSLNTNEDFDVYVFIYYLFDNHDNLLITETDIDSEHFLSEYTYLGCEIIGNAKGVE